ncbi:olfactory receptor 11L1-like [Ascaphus truei]|uniref:olfactory receptor 11L1-like n=1 Tax=Ascaphus truei TaxID=8439 RepID=UPI003F5ACD39
MLEINQTITTTLILLGFENLQSCKMFVFIFFLIIYVMTLIGNLLIVVLVLTSHHLSAPMYVFLSNLSLSETLFTTNIVPNMLWVIWAEGGAMSITGCIVQFYFFGASTTIESFLLTVMSYDRYLAICNPLRYTSIMNLRLCHKMVSCCWVSGLTLMAITIILVCRLQFCLNVIDHFFCDLGPLLTLSCSDTFIVEMEIFVVSIPLVIFPFVFIVVTYVCIFLSILRISSTTGRKKAFSTCSSHMTVVGLYYGTLMALYIAPSKGRSFRGNKILSLLYTVVTPLCNPIIYSLRNKEIKITFRTQIQKLIKSLNN